MNKVEAVADNPAVKPLPPFMRLKTGTFVTIRQRGHTRTHGEEYFAPAIVLAQYSPNGEIDCLVFDSTSSVNFQNAFSIRDVSVRGEGHEREMFVSQHNIGDVLFDPQQMSALANEVDILRSRMSDIAHRITALERESSGVVAQDSKDRNPVGANEPKTTALGLAPNKQKQ